MAIVPDLKLSQRCRCLICNAAAAMSFRQNGSCILHRIWGEISSEDASQQMILSTTSSCTTKHLALVAGKLCVSSRSSGLLHTHSCLTVAPITLSTDLLQLARSQRHGANNLPMADSSNVGPVNREYKCLAHLMVGLIRLTHVQS